MLFSDLRTALVWFFGWGCLAIAAIDLAVSGPGAANLVTAGAAAVTLVALRLGGRPDRLLLLLTAVSLLAVGWSVDTGSHPPATLFWIAIVPVLATLAGSMPVAVGASVVALAGAAWIASRTGVTSTSAQIVSNLSLVMLAMGGMSAFYFVWRRRSLDALAAMGAGFEDLVDRQPVGTLVVTEGRIDFGNAEAALLFERHPHDLVGKPLEDLLPVAAAATHDSLEVAIGGAGRTVRIERQPIQFLGRDSELITVVDETERAQAESERLERELRLGRSQRLELVGHLTGGIAHDFNNLLTTVLANSELLIDSMEARTADPEDSLSMLRSVRSAAVEASSLVKQLLAYSGRGVVFRESLQVGDSVSEALRLIHRRAAASGVEITLGEVDPEARLIVDPGRLQQVILNILSNAVRASAAVRGNVQVSVRRRSVTRKELKASLIEDGKPEPGRYVEIEVRDQGSGVGRRARSYILEPYRGDWEHRSGLGLAAVAGIVTGERGALLLDSGRDGSTFRVLLPEPEVVPAAAEERPQRSLAILLVDDDLQALDLIEHLLAGASHRVTRASSFREAWKLVETRIDDFDVVVSDHRLPDGTGTDLLVHVRSVRPELPVLLCSGFRVGQHRPDCGLPELVKPFQPDELIAWLEQNVTSRRDRTKAQAVEAS